MPPIIRYTPSKSSCWGHATKRLTPGEFRARVADFLENAAGQFVEARYCLHDEAGVFSDIVGDVPGHGEISASALERCLDWVVSNPDKVPDHGSPGFFLLQRVFHITSWKGGDGVSMPMCLLTEQYGPMHMLATMLQFDSVSEYQRVKERMARIVGIQMNDAHLKPKRLLSQRGFPPIVDGSPNRPFAKWDRHRDFNFNSAAKRKLARSQSHIANYT